jgi:hypothetical protein
MDSLIYLINLSCYDCLLIILSLESARSTFFSAAAFYFASSKAFLSCASYSALFFSALAAFFSSFLFYFS